MGNYKTRCGIQEDKTSTDICPGGHKSFILWESNVGAYALINNPNYWSYLMVLTYLRRVSFVKPCKNFIVYKLDLEGFKSS